MSGEGEKDKSVRRVTDLYKVGDAVNRLLQSNDFAKIGRVVEAFAQNKEFSQIGLAANKINEQAERFANTIGGRSAWVESQGLNSNILKMFDQNSDWGRTIAAIKNFRAVTHWREQFSDPRMKGLAQFGDAFRLTMRSNVPKFFQEFANENSDFLELISSGEIDLDAAVDSFQSAAAEAEAADDALAEPPLDSAKSEQGKSEVLSALLAAGSLKGVSSTGLKYFIGVMTVLFFLLNNFNQFVEAQKNFSGFFSNAETPAAARLQARRLPNGVEREQLSGFRVLVGDNVQLREGPGRKYLAMESLKVGSLLRVLDSDGKAWIYVSVMVDGELIEGWIFRRYAKRIR